MASRNLIVFIRLLLIGVACAVHAAGEVGRVCPPDRNGVVAGQRYVVFGEAYYCRLVDDKRLMNPYEGAFRQNLLNVFHAHLRHYGALVVKMNLDVVVQCLDE